VFPKECLGCARLYQKGDDSMQLSNQVALITGGGDVGVQTAKRFLKEGAQVIIVTDRIPPLMQQALDEINDPSLLKAVIGDVRDLAQMQAAAEDVVREYGKIDILFTTAGVIRHKPIHEMTAEDWSFVMDINMTGVFNICKAVVPHMKERQYGRIIHVSSLGGRTGRPIGVNYAASKAGVIGLTMTLSYELGPDNITVNAIAPGPLFGSMLADSPAEYIDQLKQGARIFRLGKPEEVAGCAAFLAGPDAGWITGEVLDMNGGLYY